MKKIALLLIALFTTGSMLMANPGPRKGGHRNMDIKARAERMAERMTKEYALNDTQKRQVYEANLIMIADMQPSKANKPSKEERGERMKEGREKQIAQIKKSREEYDAKLKNILTKDQYETYAKKQAERQKRMSERMSERKNARSQSANN